MTCRPNLQHDLGEISPFELTRIADAMPLSEIGNGKTRDALRRAAKEILQQRNYIDQLHAQLDAS